jgi:hypothetical protein
VGAAALGAALLLADGSAFAQDIGRIKTVNGTVHIERAGRRGPAQVGGAIWQSDTLVTGPDGAVGVTFADQTLLSAGPNSVLVIERFIYDGTRPGAFDASLAKGTLSVVSGRIAKQAQDAMRIRTPSAILGVRGTEFAVRASDGAP